MSKRFSCLLLSMLLVVSILSGCGNESTSAVTTAVPQSTESVQVKPEVTEPVQTEESTVTENIPETTELPTTLPEVKAPAFDISIVPAFSGIPYVAVNENTPYFTSDEITTSSFEQYAPLDSRGRCGVAMASIGRDLMPTEERGSIGMVKPTGWHTVKYDCVDGKYLYNRCHLIGFQLTGENANTSNLITGTRYLNIEGMLPFENMVADYIKETGNHVMYRSTPIFEGANLLATGVLMEGWSVEDDGDGICYCVFAYNAQPGVTLDYATGDSYSEYVPEPTQPPVVVDPPADDPADAPGVDYILNKNSKKFHYPECPSVDRMKESNKEYYTGSREDLIARGYDPCKNCNP